jgi:hypothetical protein
MLAKIDKHCPHTWSNTIVTLIQVKLNLDPLNNILGSSRVVEKNVIGK